MVSNLDIRGEVVINAPNVTLKNCRVTGTSFVAVSVFAPGVRIEDCEILSVYSMGGTKGIYFDVPGSGGSVRRCNIHSVEDGVYISTRNVVVEDNYVHDLNARGGDPHYDGIQLHGGVSSDVVIRHNSVNTRWSDNSAITMGAVQNVLVENNRLYGGGYTLRIDARHNEGDVSGVSILNNRFGPHEAGYLAFDNATATVNGNVDDRTGEPIP
jgi:polygalacturonase